MELPDYGRLDFPTHQTLNVGIEWIERHCVVPDGFQKGDPFHLTGWQLYAIANHYRVKPSAVWIPDRPMLAPAFHYRRSQIVLPQKAGKAPHTSAQVCLEAVGPALFAGWGARGDEWRCSDHGCPCRWVYRYAKGEAMGMPWPTPLIQITATSEEQTDNIYDALRPMIDLGRLAAVIPKTGEEFIRLPNDGRIDVVTSSATSRLGQRVTFVPQDETGVWTPENKMVKVAETQRRGLAGMGGRACETTNAWDPTVVSVAKRTGESKSKDIFRLHPQPPTGLDYKVKADRRKIHVYVYHGSPWVDLDSIEGEAAELLETDPAQAERFFGNRVVAGSGKAFDLDRWKSLAQPGFVVPDRDLITVGFDGSKFYDASALVATHVESGHQWPLLIEERPENAGEDFEIDAQSFTDALAVAFDTWKVWAVYCDPPKWEDTINAWAGRWGPKRIKAWPTYRPKQMAYALAAYRSAMQSGMDDPSGESNALSHDGDGVFTAHIGNAVRADTNVKDEQGRPMWLIRKEAPKSPLKIDAAMAGCLSWEARGDAIAAGALRTRSRTIRF